MLEERLPEGLTFDDRLSGSNLRQRIDCVDAVIVDVRPRCIDVDDDLKVCCAQPHFQSIDRWSTAPAAGEVVNQFVAHAHADTGKAAAARRVN